MHGTTNLKFLRKSCEVEHTHTHICCELCLKKEPKSNASGSLQENFCDQGFSV